jgi:hypothetical protein
LTKSEEWDEREKQLSQPTTEFLTELEPNMKCDHGRLATEGQCLLCLFGDDYENPEELQ